MTTKEFNSKKVIKTMKNSISEISNLKPTNLIKNSNGVSEISKANLKNTPTNAINTKVNNTFEKK